MYSHKFTIPSESDAMGVLQEDSKTYFASHTTVYEVAEGKLSIYCSVEGTITGFAKNGQNVFITTSDRVYMCNRSGIIGSLKRMATFVSSWDDLLILGLNNGTIEVWEIPTSFRFTLFKRISKHVGHKGRVIDIKRVYMKESVQMDNKRMSVQMDNKSDNEKDSDRIGDYRIMTVSEDNTVRLFNLRTHKTRILARTKSLPCGLQEISEENKGIVWCRNGYMVVFKIDSKGKESDFKGKESDCKRESEMEKSNSKNGKESNSKNERECDSKVEKTKLMKISDRIILAASSSGSQNSPSQPPSSVAVHEENKVLYFSLFREERELQRCVLPFLPEELSVSGNKVALRSRHFLLVFDFDSGRNLFTLDFPKFVCMSVYKGILGAGCKDQKVRIYKDNLQVGMILGEDAGNAGNVGNVGNAGNGTMMNERTLSATHTSTVHTSTVHTSNIHTSIVHTSTVHTLQADRDILNLHMSDSSCCVVYKSGHISVFNLRDGNCYRSFTVAGSNRESNETITFDKATRDDKNIKGDKATRDDKNVPNPTGTLHSTPHSTSHSFHNSFYPFTHSCISEDNCVLFLADTKRILIVNLQRSKLIEEVTLSSPLTELIYHRNFVYFVDFSNQVTKLNVFNGKSTLLQLEKTCSTFSIHSNRLLCAVENELLIYDLDFNYLETVYASLEGRNREEVYSKNKAIESVGFDEERIICGGRVNQLKVIRYSLGGVSDNRVSVNRATGDNNKTNESDNNKTNQVNGTLTTSRKFTASPTLLRSVVSQVLRVSENKDLENFKTKLMKERKGEFKKTNFIETRKLILENKVFYVLSREGIKVYSKNLLNFNPIEFGVKGNNKFIEKSLSEGNFVPALISALKTGEFKQISRVINLMNVDGNGNFSFASRMLPEESVELVEECLSVMYLRTGEIKLLEFLMEIVKERKRIKKGIYKAVESKGRREHEMIRANYFMLLGLHRGG